VAHSLSAKKRIRQNVKRNARNRARKDAVKVQAKSFAAAVTAGNKEAAETEFRKLSSKLAKTASKKTIHKKTAARKRSRAAKRLNTVSAAKTA
jgi:small subunit ribosomal protein S20